MSHECEYAILTVEEVHTVRYALPLDSAITKLIDSLENSSHEEVPFDSTRDSARVISTKIVDTQTAIDICGEHGYDAFKHAFQP